MTTHPTPWYSESIYVYSAGGAKVCGCTSADAAARIVQAVNRTPAVRAIGTELAALPEAQRYSRLAELCRAFQGPCICGCHSFVATQQTPPPAGGPTEGDLASVTETADGRAHNPTPTPAGGAVAKGWLLEGLRDAQREADAQPELRRRVADHPSGFLPEASNDPPAPTEGGPTPHKLNEAVTAAIMEAERNPRVANWRQVLECEYKLFSEPSLPDAERDIALRGIVHAARELQALRASVATEGEASDEPDKCSLGEHFAAGPMTRTIAELVRACEVSIEEELRKPLPDTHVIALLCDATRMAREYVDFARAANSLATEQRVRELEAENERLTDELDAWRENNDLDMRSKLALAERAIESANLRAETAEREHADERRKVAELEAQLTVPMHFERIPESDDGDTHCDGCGAVVDEETPHTWKDCAAEIRRSENMVVAMVRDHYAAEAKDRDARIAELERRLAETHTLLATIADEAFGPFPIESSEKLLGHVAQGIAEQRRTIHGLRTQIAALRVENQQSADQPVEPHSLEEIERRLKVDDE